MKKSHHGAKFIFITNKDKSLSILQYPEKAPKGKNKSGLGAVEVARVFSRDDAFTLLDFLNDDDSPHFGVMKGW